jgi:hypothetical protein
VNGDVGRYADLPTPRRRGRGRGRRAPFAGVGVFAVVVVAAAVAVGLVLATVGTASRAAPPGHLLSRANEAAAVFIRGPARDRGLRLWRDAR